MKSRALRFAVPALVEATAPYYRVAPPRARRILQELRAALSGWRRRARAADPGTGDRAGRAGVRACGEVKPGAWGQAKPFRCRNVLHTIGP